MSSYLQKRRNLIEEAQQWERILKSGNSIDHAAFVAWIRRSPEHLEAYLQNMSVEAEIEGLDANGDFDIQALLREASANVVQLSSSIPIRGPLPLPCSERPKTCGEAGAIAASALLTLSLIVGGIRSSSSQWTDYTTGTGEQRRIVLADGSTVELNTKSHIRVSIRSRAIDLIAGEALFSVRHDSHRPFHVRVGDQIIEDLGTQFSIYRRPDASTTVSVLDGRVQVSSGNPTGVPSVASKLNNGTSELVLSAELSAGEQIRMTADGRLINRGVINTLEAVSWREHRLWFDAASLQDVASEFNRYNKRQIRIGANPALSKKRYTGTFNTYDPESFVEVLKDDPSLEVQSNNGELLVEAR